VAADPASGRIFAVGGYNGGYISALNIYTAAGDITWSSGTPAVAAISVSGLATGVTNGSTTISAASGSVTGSTMLTVVVAPTISVQPMNATASPNGTVTLSVTASGGALNYQWQFNGTNIAGATGSSLTLTNVSAAQAGAYTVIVSNVAGMVPSSTATLSLLGLNMYAGLTIFGKVGGVYEIDYRTNLSSSNWTVLTNVTLTTSPYLFFDATSQNVQIRFYRSFLLP
jgi:hypothetical protein